MDGFFSTPDDHSFGALRAGWRFVIFLLIALGIPVLLSQLVQHLVPHHSASTGPSALSPLITALSEGLLFGWVALVTWIMSRIEHRHWGTFGLPGRGAFGRRFWQGVVWGVVSLTVLLLLIFASGDFQFGSVVTHGSALWHYALGWAIAFLAVGFFEEFFFRGYMLTTLTEGMGFWPAAILLSCLFGAVHLNNSGEAWIGALSAGAIGLFFCFTRQRTGSLWFAVGMHAAWDYCESFVYGVPDSGQISPGRLLAPPKVPGSHWITGGTIGPEGSVWVFVVIVLLFAVFALCMPERRPASGSAAETGSGAQA